MSLEGAVRPLRRGLLVLLVALLMLSLLVRAHEGHGEGGEGECPDPVSTSLPSSSYTYVPRCNHNSMDITRALAKSPSVGTKDWWIGRQNPGLRLRASFMNSCTGDCSSQWQTARVGVDAWVRRPCTRLARGNDGNAKRRMVGLVNDVGSEFDDKLYVRHVYRAFWAKHSYDQAQHQCFFTNESKVITFSEWWVNLQVVVTFAVPPKGDHWAGVPMWAIPCAWGNNYVSNRPMIIRLNIHELAHRMSDAELKRDIRHHLLHAMGLDGTTGAHFGTETTSLGRTQTVMTDNHWIRDPYRAQFGCAGAVGAPVDDEVRLKTFYSVPDMFRRNESWLRVDRLRGQSESSCNMQQQALLTTDTGGGSCGPKIDASAINDPNRHSHFESRVMGSDLAITSVWGDRVNDFVFKALANTGFYIIWQPNHPTGSAVTAANPTCDLLRKKCTDASNRATDLFCVPPEQMTNSTTTCSANYKDIRKCGLAFHNASFFAATELQAFKYFAASQTRGGLAPADDFCPRPVATLKRCTESSSKHRCFDHMVVATGSSPATEGASVCYEARCLYGTSVEFKLPGDSEFTKCPNPDVTEQITLPTGSGRFQGTIMCPKAADFCDRDINVMPAEPTWTRAPGTDIEYGFVSETATRQQAALACASYGHGAAIAFLQTSAVADFVTGMVGGTSAPPVWIGTTEGGWTTTHGHTLPARFTNSASNQAGVACGTLAEGRFNAAGSCDLKLKFVCSRPRVTAWYLSPPPGLASVGFGQPKLYRPSNIYNSFVMWAPALATGAQAAVTADNAFTMCSGDTEGAVYAAHIAEAVLLGNDDDKRAALRAFAAAGGLGLTSDTPGYWTDLSYSPGGSVSVWWADLVVGGIHQETPAKVCYLLGRPDPKDTSRVLYPTECDRTYPAVCLLRNVVQSNMQSTYMRLGAAFVAFPATYADASGACASLGSGYDLAPVPTTYFADATRWHARDRIQTKNYNAPRAFRVGGKYEGGSFTFPSVGPDPIEARTAQYLPTANREAFTEGVQMMWDTARDFRPASATDAIPVLCARVMPTTTTGTCSNGTWCWDMRTDHRLMFIEDPVAKGSDVASVCAAVGGLPAYEAPVPARIDEVLFTLFGTDSRGIRAFHTGMKVVGGQIVGVNSSEVVSGYNFQDSTTFHDGPPKNGDCLWGSKASWRNGGKLQLQGNNCERYAPVLCKQPISTKFVPWLNESRTPESDWNYEYTMSAAALTYDEALQTCNSSDGTLAFFKYDQEEGLFRTEDVFPQLEVTAGSFWFGLQDPFDAMFDFRTPYWIDALYQKRLDGAFANSNNPPANPKCYTITPSGYTRGAHTERPCGTTTEKHRALCIRSRDRATWSIPENLYAGPDYITSQNNKLRFAVPAGNSKTNGANIQVRATSNFTNFSVPVSDLRMDPTSTISIACDNVTEPTVASFDFEIVKSFASVRSDRMKKDDASPQTSTVWPCLRPVTEAPAAPVRGSVVGTAVNVTLRMDALFKDGSYAEINLNPSAGLECSATTLRFDKPATANSSEHRKTVTCSSTVAGTVHTIEPTYRACLPAQLCRIGDRAFEIPDMRFLFADAAEFAIGGTQLLSGSEYAGTLRLKRSNGVPYKVRLGVPEAMNVNQTEWLWVNTTDPLPFTASTSTDGTFPMNVTLSLADGANATWAQQERFLQYATFALGTVTFIPTFPITADMWTPYADAAGTERLYAGQPFYVNFTVPAEAFARDANTELEVGVQSGGMLFEGFNGTGLTTTIRDAAKCCQYTMKLVAMPNVTQILANPPSGFEVGEALLHRLVFRPTSGSYAASLPMPALGPLLELHAVKTISLASTIDRVFAGGPSAAVILSLPQTPADTTARMSISCDSTHLQATPPLVEWRAQQWAGFSARRTFTLTSPATSNFHLEKETNVRCTMLLTAGNDVRTTVSDINVFVAPQAKITYWVALPASVLPGTSFNLQLRIAVSDYARALPETTPVVSNSAVSIVPHPSIGQQYVDGGRAVMRTFLVNVGATKADGSALRDDRMCVNFVVGDTKHYQTPAENCFAILPRITVDLTFPAGEPRLSQPVGPASGQRISVGLSSTPIGTTDVVIELGCIRTIFSGAVSPNVTIATFEAPRLTFKAMTLTEVNKDGGIGRVPPRQTATLYGVVSEQLCKIGYRIVPAEEGSSMNLQMTGSTTGLTELMDKNILFAELLYVTYSKRNLRDALYVGDDTAGSLVVRIPQGPSRPMTIRCLLTGATDSSGTAVTVEPAEVNVTGGAGVTEHTFTLKARRTKVDTVPVSYQLQLITDAGEYAQEIANATGTFAVRNPIALVMRDPLGLNVGDSLTMYCGGERTAKVISIEVPYAPTNLQSPVQLAFTSNSSALAVSPSRQHFGADAWASDRRSATFSLACSDAVKNASAAVWDILVTAPPEYLPRASVVVNQKPLVGFTVDSLFNTIPVGAVLAFNVRPNLLPPTGTRLKLRFTTSCGNAIRIFDNGLGFSIEWSENAATRTIPLIATAAFANCEIGLVTDDSSTAHIFQYTALTHRVTITDVPRVLAVPGRAPRKVVSDDLSDGVDFAFTVTNAAFDEQKAATSDTMAAARTSTACVLVKASGDVTDETSVAFAYGQQRDSVSARVSEAGELIVSVSMSIVGKVTAEDLTFTFTSNCFQVTADAPTAVDPHPDYRNFTVKVEPPPEPLGVANEVVAGTALALSAFSASPSMGTGVAKLSFVQQATCDLQNIEASYYRELSFAEHPVGLPIGAVSDMGNMLGAAVFDSVILVGIFVLHAFGCFFLYVIRRDFAVEDKSFWMAAGILRFPGATTIAAMYFLPLIGQFSLSVAINARGAGMRGAGGAIFGVVTICGAAFVCLMMKRHAADAVWIEDKPVDSLPWYKQLYRIRGKWRCDSERERLAFGYLYDDFITQVRYYNIVELSITCCIGIAAAIEPTSFRGCLVKVGFICALFALNFLFILVARPFRRHVANIFFGLMTLALATASAVALGSITGRSNSTTKWAADVSVQVVGNLILLKLLFDFGVWAYEVFLRKHVQKLRKDEVLVKFKVADEPMYVEDLFPHTRKTAAEWDEAADDINDLDESLLNASRRNNGVAPEVEAARAREAEERRRAKEIMDAI